VRQGGGVHHKGDAGDAAQCLIVSTDLLDHFFGVTDQQGTVLEYTLQNFVQVMIDLPDLWNRLREECDNMRNFQDDELEEEVEKLGESLSGS